MRDTIYKLLKTSTIQAPAMLLENYNQLGLSVNDVLFVLEFIHCNGDIMKIGHHMQMNQDNIMVQINRLLEKQHIVMDMTTTPNGKKDMIYSLEPLYQKMVTLLIQRAHTTEVIDENNLISLFEQEFGRALSGTELETISEWIKVENYSEELIKLALKEAVLSQALNLKYIDRILLAWERKNIKTPQQVSHVQQQYRQSKITSDSETVDDVTASVLLHDWMKG